LRMHVELLTDRLILQPISAGQDDP
jgi:hypothetical protein